jgi:hypothetical protein
MSVNLFARDPIFFLNLNLQKSLKNYFYRLQEFLISRKLCNHVKNTLVDSLNGIFYLIKMKYKLKEEFKYESKNFLNELEYVLRNYILVFLKELITRKSCTIAFL